MNKIIVIILIAFSFGVLNCKKTKHKNVTLKTLEDSVSYSIGAIVAQQVIQSGDDKIFNREKFYAALNHVLDSSKMQISKQEIQNVLNKYRKQVNAARQEELKHIAEENLDKGKEFMAKNKLKEGIKITESGIQYKIIKKGKGRKPKLSDKVKIHYHGTLIDGTVFDSSLDRGSPLEHPVNQFIKGWKEILQMMPVGSEWMVYIPPELAYGTSDMGQIKPNSTLIFNMELLAIVTKKKSRKRK